MPRPKVLPMGKGHEVFQIDSSPKISRTKVLSAGKSHVVYQNESGPPTASQDESGATTADPMSELLTMITKEINMKFEELDGLLVTRGNKLDDMVKYVRIINQRRAGLEQLQAQQPRLAVKAGVLDNKKTCKSREDCALDGRLGDISSDRVHAPMRLSSFGDQEYIEPPARPCRDDTLVNQGYEVPKPWLLPVEMRKSTPAGGLLQCLTVPRIQTSRNREKENLTAEAGGSACTSSSTRFSGSVIMMSSELLQSIYQSLENCRVRLCSRERECLLL